MHKSIRKVARTMVLPLKPYTLGVVACLLMLALFPIIYGAFPTYAPGYLIQLTAVAVGIWYFDRFDLWSRYADWRQLSVLLLAFALPLQNTFWIKAYRKAVLSSHLILEIFRPEIILLLAIVASATLRPTCPRRLPTLLMLSIFSGVLGYIFSLGGSTAPMLTLAVGFFEVLVPFASLYALIRLAPNREFLWHAAKLMVLSFTLVAISLISAAFIKAQSMPGAAMVPLSADDFQFLKRHLDYLRDVGGNAFENPDFFISLWVLLLPAALLGFYKTRFRVVAAVTACVLVYAGLLQYSRAGILILALGAILGFLTRAVVERKVSWLPLIIVAVLAIIHVNPPAVEYIKVGIEQFNDRLQHKTLPDQPILDASGQDRATSILQGIDIGAREPITGVGFGTYGMHAEYPPHSMLVYRFAEGGIFSALSIVLLALYAPIGFAAAALRRDTDLIVYASFVATGCFMLKAIVFGGSFSLVGIVVWGFAFSLLTSLTIIRGENA